jgi:uncharacterized protein (DUF1015 family)
MNKRIVVAPHILLPRKGTDMSAYAVIACDQFTSQVEYWNDLKDMIGDKLSTFHMIYPEAYLESTDQNEYIQKINQNIDSYLKDNLLVDMGECFVLVERVTAYGVRRLGLVISIDLEEYSYERGVPCSIKASEATIIERIPPRLKIRKDAPIELPHTLLLFDDKEKSNIEQLYAKRKELDLLYDFELNQNGGHIRGYLVKDTEAVIKKFNDIYKKNNNGLMFIVGDGNHSLATAKAHWENIKKTLSKEEQENHPARFALVEANNVYDDGIIFEPIHRILFKAGNFQNELNALDGDGSLAYSYSKKEGKKAIKTPKSAAETYQIIQKLIDKNLKENPEMKVDFIHDESSVLEIADKNPDSLAIVMPALGKSDIFEFVAKDMVLPRKSFSMGHASEKRYYLEAKKIA